MIFFYFISLIKIVSGRYSDLGFVYRPFLIGSVGGLSYLISVLITIFILLNVPSSEVLNALYYYVFFYAALSIVTVTQFLRFVVDYPSAIQPKWKAYLPIDPIRIATALTLAFLSISLYFTLKDLGIVVAIPGWALVISAVLFVPAAILFLYTRTFAGETTLGYWNYIKAEITAHLALSFYILSVAAVLWHSLEFTDKILFSVFFGLSMLFYITTTLDIRKLTRDLNVKVQPNPLDIARYAVSIFSLFFTIFFLVILTQGKTTTLDVFLGRYPFFPLTLIGIFFLFYFTFLRRTHKGFEELMERGVITTLSYFAGLGVFITVFVMYIQFPEGLLSQFPFFGLVFFGYFTILIADVYSTTTLRVKEYTEKKDIMDLLNHVAGHFFRTDVLEEMWDDVVESYKDIDPDLEKARFYAPERTFDLSMVNEKARSAAAVAMLYKMDSAANRGGVPVVPFDDDVKAEIEKLLGEKLLLLPPELAKDFKADKYYTKLLESTITRINDAIKPFLSLEDYSSLVKNLVAVDEFFKNIIFTEEGVRINLAAELGRKGFLKYLRLYIKGLGDTFPFNRMLLREAVQTEVKTRLSLYGFTRADVLNVVPSGVKELDEVLYGGFIKGTSTLFLTEERRAKNDVLFMFISEGLKEGEPGIFATSRVSSKDLLDLFNRVSDSQENLSIIDLYLSTHTDNVVHIPIKKDDRQIISTSLIQVKQAVVADVKKHSKDVHKRIVLDIYTDLAKYQNTDEILDLVKKQVEGFRRWNVTSIITLAPDLATDELERHFDNVMVLSDVATIKIKKLFGGKPKKESFVIWGTYAPMEEPDYSLFFED